MKAQKAEPTSTPSKAFSLVATSPDSPTPGAKPESPAEALANLLRLEAEDFLFKRFYFFCPTHDDHRRSLSIGIGKNGRFRLHCEAGCTRDAILLRLNCEDIDDLKLWLGRAIQKTLLFLVEDHRSKVKTNLAPASPNNAESNK